jgi:hypothetical protein
MSTFADLNINDLLIPEETGVSVGPTLASEIDELEPRRDPAWLKFEDDLRTGLRLVKRKVMANIAEGKPKKVTVAWVLREAGRGRSQFYAAHSAFERRIALVQRAVERLIAIRRGEVGRQPGKTSLMEENRKLRALVRNLEAKEISKAAVIAFEKAFPRDLTLLTVENSRLHAEVARLSHEAAQLRKHMRMLAHYQDIPARRDENILQFPGKN